MNWTELLLENWPVKLVCLVLVVSAYIDGKQLRVPNWITFPMVLSGLIYNAAVGSWGDWDHGFVAAIAGTFVGLGCLLPLYAVGGMGAGDVKLMAGIGAWLGPTTTVYAFCVSAILGGLMALVMMWWRGDLKEHYANLLAISFEWMTIRDPRKLSELAAERKPRMMLLPYGIPICIGSIAYFLYSGLL